VSDRGPGIVVLHWSPANAGLIDELARTMAGAGVATITCVRDGSGPFESEQVRGIEVRTLSLDAVPGSDAHVEQLIHEVEIANAHAVIVLPQLDSDEPDSGSRLTCAAIRRACGNRVGPNVLVEIEDPEAAFEFVGLGVATVFYPGHLRAALLGQACVDLGVFQFVIGLLRGRHRVRSIPVPESLRNSTFAEAALSLECDDEGRAMTVIGVARDQSEGGQPINVVVNPGPQTLLREVVCLLALVAGDTERETSVP
jgi:Trk K+ transport system NAD-binding subunit